MYGTTAYNRKTAYTSADMARLVAYLKSGCAGRVDLYVRIKYSVKWLEKYGRTVA